MTRRLRPRLERCAATRRRVAPLRSSLIRDPSRSSGEFVWHDHPDTDEFFLVLTGHLVIQMRDGDVSLHPGEVFVVPRGVEHCPLADEGTAVALLEPAGVINTGAAGGELTAPVDRHPDS